MKVLSFVGYYLPGSRAGGPIRSISNLVAGLADEIDFLVVTSDRDLGDDGPYPGVERDKWLRVGKAQVRYLSPQARSLSSLARLIRATPHDVLYLNSFFSAVYTIRPLLLRRTGRIPLRPTVVAPRGELAFSALGMKAPKKKVYSAAARAAGLYRDVTWQATSAAEAADIRREIGPHARIGHGPAVFAMPEGAPGEDGAPHRRGSARLAYLARIAPVKNPHMLAESLADVDGAVSLHLYGVIDDSGYWARCQAAFAALPSSVTVTYHGPVDHDQVSGILAQVDLFVLPTLGENFCHAAAEAFAAGCPVLISDQTPWRGLEKAKAGWDLPLDQPEAFTKAVQRVIDMDECEHREWRQGARSYIESHPLITEAIELNRQLFLSQIQS